MAKPPRQKHSRPSVKPVTIDLAAEPDKASDDAAEPVAFDTAAVTEDATASVEAASDAPAAEEDAAEPRQSDVEDGQAAERPASRQAPKSPPPAGAGRTGSALTGGLIGGLLALLVAAGGQWLGLIPSLGGNSEPAVSQEELAALATKVDALAAQPAGSGLGDAVGQLRTDLDALAQRTGELETSVAALAEQPAAGDATGGEAIAALRQRIDAMQAEIAALPRSAPAADGTTPPAPAVDIAPLQDRIASLADELAALTQRVGDAAGTAQTASEGVSALDGRMSELGTRIDTLDASVAKLSARPDSALPVAAAALKSAMDRGGAFTQELETYAGVTGDAETVAALRDFAGSGVPTAADLVSSFPAAANAMLDAVNKPAEGAGLVDRLMDSARGLVRIRPVGEVEGEGPEAVVARIEAHLVDGDLAAALAEFETLPEPARQAGSAWVERLKSRMTAEKLVEDKLNAVLTGTGN